MIILIINVYIFRSIESVNVLQRRGDSPNVYRGFRGTYQNLIVDSHVQHRAHVIKHIYTHIHTHLKKTTI